MGIPFFNRDRADIDEKYDKAEEDETSVGNILLEWGYITEAVLEEAIGIQKSQSLLGRILVSMGAITEEQLEEVLLEQKVRRKSKARDIIKLNQRKHGRLVDEVEEGLDALNQKYLVASKE